MWSKILFNNLLMKGWILNGLKLFVCFFVLMKMIGFFVVVILKLYIVILNIFIFIIVSLF